MVDKGWAGQDIEATSGTSNINSSQWLAWLGGWKVCKLLRYDCSLLGAVLREIPRGVVTRSPTSAPQKLSQQY